MQIKNNLITIHQQIKQYCLQVQRPESAVKLLAVSKTKPVEAILAAYHAGQTAFGENYVQEGIEKIQYFEQQNIQLEWHFIGSLQSNKTKLVAEHFDWMQTLDRLKTAERLNQQRPLHKAPLNVLIQINISNEDSKGGIPAEEMSDFAKQLKNLPHLRLRGLMAIAAATDNEREQMQVFSANGITFPPTTTRIPFRSNRYTVYGNVRRYGECDKMRVDDGQNRNGYLW